MGLQEAILYEVKQQGIAEGKQQGIAEGIAKGKQQGIAEAEKKKILAIQNMLKKGFSEIEIAEIFGMATQEIVALRKMMNL